MNKAQIMMMFSINPFDNDKDSIFSNKHIMTSHELVNQVWGYTAEVQKSYLSPETPIFVATKAIPSNGARVVVALLNDEGKHMGYTCNVYAVSRRVNIVGQICDMFERGATELSEDDWNLCLEEAN